MVLSCSSAEERFPLEEDVGCSNQPGTTIHNFVFRCLSLKTADMFWSTDFEVAICSSYLTENDFETLVPTCEAIPCWSLGALMDLLPPSIQTGEGMQNHYEIDIRKYWGDEENLYQIAYGNNRGLSEELHDMINTGEKENLTDAAFQMICWLLENNYIKKVE